MLWQSHGVLVYLKAHSSWAFPRNRLARKLRCDRRRSTLRCGQITRDAVFVRGEDDHLVQQMVASGVELQGLSDGAVLLLNRTVVGHYVDRKAALLRIHFFQLQAHGCDRRPGSLVQSEVVIIALTLALQ